MTNPEMININELKRLLIEIVEDVLKDVELIGMTFGESRQMKIARISRAIDRAVLNGDDS